MGQRNKLKITIKIIYVSDNSEESVVSLVTAVQFSQHLKMRLGTLGAASMGWQSKLNCLTVPVNAGVQNYSHATPCFPPTQHGVTGPLWYLSAQFVCR